jgi:hypothetical protein
MAALDARSLLTHETTFPRMRLLHRSGRHRQNGGRLEIGMVGAIRSERWAASDRNRWAAYVRIRRELRYRQITYPSLIKRGALTEAAADRQNARLQATLDVLVSLEEIDSDARICTPSIPMMHSGD